MNKWIDRLVAQVNTKTHADNLTYKTYETLPDEKENALQDSFVGFVGDFPDTRDAETVIERAAIQEYDGNLERDRANMEASAGYDRNRQSYEQANPGRDPRNVEALYRAYIARWQPDHKGDLPATPPNTRGNAGLWRAWWRRVEGQNHG